MKPDTPTSLTGSSSGAPTTHAAPVSAALGRIRFGVVLCCWVAGLALLAQTLVWSLSTFTDMRWQTLNVQEKAPLVVTPGTTGGSTLLTTESDRAAHEAVDPNHVVSAYDRTFLTASMLARGTGTIAMLVLACLIALGAILGCSTATAGVDKTVSSFGWAVVVGLLILPVGRLVGMPWHDGALWTYDAMTAAVDARRAAAPVALTATAVFFAKYLLMPMACLAGVAFVGLRFHAGVEAGLLMKEDIRLDVHLEQEAANVKPTSLHGGRANAAMRSTMGGEPIAVEKPAAGATGGLAIGGSPVPPPRIEKPEPKDGPTIRHLSTGEPPKRLI